MLQKANFDYDWSTPTVRIKDDLHPQGFIVINRSEFEERCRERARAVAMNDMAAAPPEMVLYKELKPAA